MPAQQQTFTLDRLPTPIGDMLVVTDPMQRLRVAPIPWPRFSPKLSKSLTELFIT